MAEVDYEQPRNWTAWMTWWTCLCLPSFGFAFILWGPATALYVSSGIAFMATLILIGLSDSRRFAKETLRAKILRIARTALCACSAFLTVILLARISGVLSLLVIAAMALTSPPAAELPRRLRARFDRATASEPAVPADEPEQVEFSEPFETLTDVEICYLWRHSFWDLEEARTLERRNRIVALRQRILDELTRRDPLAIDAWLASGARASSSPERFFEGGGSGWRASA